MTGIAWRYLAVCCLLATAALTDSNAVAVIALVAATLYAIPLVAALVDDHLQKRGRR